MKKNNIVVVGLGYVGCSMSVLLAQKHNVASVDLNEDKVRISQGYYYLHRRWPWQNKKYNIPEKIMY